MQLQNLNSQALDLADMAGVEQLAGLVARLEAVAVKLESSGGAGGAGGDAGASVQVRKHYFTPSSAHCRSSMIYVAQASNSSLTSVTRLGVMLLLLAKCSG